jgi:rhodanese-related sulfurtransferase
MTTPPTNPAADPLPVRLARLDFLQRVTRDAANQPSIAPDVVAEQGARVVLVDIRERAELLRPLGFVPGSVHVPLARLMDLRALGDGARIVLVSRHGQRAAVAARLLELAGMAHVAALEGGLEGWRALGLPASRDPSRIVDRLPADPDAPLLQPERARARLSLEEITLHVADVARVRWVKLAAFLLHGKTACVDGRDSQGVVGTPGGDVGELLVALGAAEALCGPIDLARVPALLEGWIEAFGRVYLHSDTHALSDHIAAMRADPEIPERLLPSREDPPSAWRAFHAAPPQEIRARVLHHLLGHMGCGHLRLLLSHSEAYGVRAELARAVVESVLAAYWDGVPEIEFVVLGGGHQEGAVLLVEVDGPLHAYTRVPLVPPAFAGVQMFVHHPQVTDFQRVEAAHWLSTRPELDALRGRAREVLDALRALAGRQMELTLGHLAKGLPMYRAVYTSDRSVRVEHVD